MTPAAFKRSLAKAVPPKELSAELQALWWVGKGDWDKAHRLAMNGHSRAAAWVHAYLHRAEGDDGNAGYGIGRPNGSLRPERSMRNGPQLCQSFCEIQMPSGFVSVPLR